MKVERGHQARRGLRFAMAIALVLGTGPAPALDLDPFGLFGSRERAPAPSADALPYALTIDVVGGERALSNALQAASTLHGLRADAPPDADALVRRAQAERPDVVLMTMSQNNRLDGFLIFNEPADIRDDDIYAEHVFVGEFQATVHNQNLIEDLVRIHILTDFTDSAERNDAQFAGGQLLQTFASPLHFRQ